MSPTSVWADYFPTNRHRIRVSVLILMVLVQSIVLFVGGNVPLTVKQSKEIVESIPSEMSWNDIAFHNMKLSIFVFIPALGVGWLGWVSYNTGTVIEAIAITLNSTTITVLLCLTMFPHYWLEIIAYTIATTAGMMFLLALLTFNSHMVFHELTCLGTSLAAWGFLLMIAGFLETQLFAPLSWIILIPIIVGIVKLDLEKFGYSNRFSLVATIFLYISFFIPFPKGCPSFPITFYGFLILVLLENLSAGGIHRKIWVFLNFLTKKS